MAFRAEEHADIPEVEDLDQRRAPEQKQIKRDLQALSRTLQAELNSAGPDISGWRSRASGELNALQHDILEGVGISTYTGKAVAEHEQIVENLLASKPRKK